MDALMVAENSLHNAECIQGVEGRFSENKVNERRRATGLLVGSSSGSLELLDLGGDSGPALFEGELLVLVFLAL